MRACPTGSRWSPPRNALTSGRRWSRIIASLLCGPSTTITGTTPGSTSGRCSPTTLTFKSSSSTRAGGEAIARGRTIPFRWDRTPEDLPRGIDAVGLRALEGTATPTALSALAAEVLPDFQGRGLAGLVIMAMAAAARARQLEVLVAPVRPSWKDRYPITPIERYIRWRRDDGLPFDPWIASTHDLGRQSSASNRGQWRSCIRLPRGNAGSKCLFPTMATLCSPAVSHPSRSLRTRVATGNRTSGCSTTSELRPTGVWWDSLATCWSTLVPTRSPRVAAIWRVWHSCQLAARLIAASSTSVGQPSPKCRSGTLAREWWAERARVRTDCATSTGGRVLYPSWRGRPPPSRGRIDRREQRFECPLGDDQTPA